MILKNVAAITFITSSLLCTGYASSTHNKAPILEVVIFHSTPGVSNSSVIKAAAKVNPVLSSMPGFISRSFAHNNNEWIDIVKWKSMGDALSAAKKAPSNTYMQKFMSLMHDYKMYHFSEINFNSITAKQ